MHERRIQELRSLAMKALSRGEWSSAQAIAAQLLLVERGESTPYLVAGIAALRQHDLGAALQHLAHAAQLDPSCVRAKAELARAHITVGDVPNAVIAADMAMALGARDGGILDLLGVVYGRAGLHDRAKAAFERGVEMSPNAPQLRFNLACTYMFDGDLIAAEREFERCIAEDSRFWRAHLFLAQLRRQTLDSNHLERLHGLLAGDGQQMARLYLNLALAKEYEDLDQFEKAFAHLSAGKSAGSEGRAYQIRRDLVMFSEIARSFPESMAASDGFESQEPIFVVGMPRSGTTLVERILSTHPEVRSAGELRNFMVALQKSCGAPPEFVLDPAFHASVQRIDWSRLGRTYIASTRPTTGASPRFVDKLPHNFLFAGFIARALPQAKIICLRRDPVDTCFSNFKQLFALDSPYFDYSFDLMDTGRYYLLFDRLMAHWHRVIPGRILEIQYEELVDRPEPTTRRLFDFCGLAWTARCLDFNRNPNPVATASAVQVREPLNNRSIGRWRNYSPQLRGLIQLLSSHGAKPVA